MKSKPIACALYDYIEIACMYRYSVLLVLDSGEEVKGIATDTSTKKDKTEYLVLFDEESKEKIEIELTKLVKMKSLIKNPHFNEVDFK